ncbi:MAG: radical SAM family heme chaperone HemW [Chloroflexi bacterium]|nr:radical SAM family heme chaperone HemW [Chloroflexota bacterium]
MPRDPIALYIHIPFCETKCSYCNFNTYARLEHLIPGYIEALCTEVDAWGEALDHIGVRTIFFGGGTPSLLPVEVLERVVARVRQAFDVQSDAEVTIEANPGDVTLEKARRWRGLGVNRLSIGVQSFDDGLLQMLTRRHNAAQAEQAVRTAQQAGFDNLSLDLMYGLPNQTLDVWRSTVERALALRPAHLSAYALTVEEGTPLHVEVRQKRLPPPDSDLAADMYITAEALLESAVYRHYEISNWSRPGLECRHNMVYWRNGPFVGVGPGAHSFLDNTRFWNLRSPADYIKRLAQPRPSSGWHPANIPVVEDRAQLSDAEIASETIILAMRLDDGLSRNEVEQIADASAPRYLAALDDGVRTGLVLRDRERYRLTQRGRLLSNELFVRLLADEPQR